MIAGIVLAAGASTRMGRPKALLALPSGESFLTCLARTLRAGGIEEIVVVRRADAPEVEAEIARARLDVRLLTNLHPERGQFSSLQTALAVVDRPGVEAILVALVDVPLVSAATIRTLVQRYRQQRAAIVRPVQRGRHGHPVIFDRSLFQELRQTNPSVGAKQVLQAHVDAIVDVEVDDEGAFVDVDTPEDYQRILAHAWPPVG